MSMIDKQRIAAVGKLVELGYRFSLADGWTAGSAAAATGAGPFTAEADAMHAVLMQRAEVLQGCSEGSSEEAELESIVNAIEVYEAKRWPDGKDPGGKG
jgi:hypothetical protein